MGGVRTGERGRDAARGGVFGGDGNGSGGGDVDGGRGRAPGERRVDSSARGV